MATKIQIARPTKMELARLKKRHRLALRIQKIVKDRLSILVMEFIQTIKESARLRLRLYEEMAHAHTSFSLTAGYHGYEPLKKELLGAVSVLKIRAESRNVAGVRIPMFENAQEFSPHDEPRNPLDYSGHMEHTQTLAHSCLETLVELAELQKSLDLLGIEINKVKRINNALEYVVIPSLFLTIKYLNMKFEERDREEAARLKRVKLLIEQREAYAY
ncbi:MAG TPA: V-type ATP synthase subunit D [Deltaproteobacteria bacterium]|nr:V-type ATP synthase subunit D [Deltaproteobacteria bacterium]HPJ93551.1 V-type ATP synthase subunit D [Deltaproteobacteria bacterium]